MSILLRQCLVRTAAPVARIDAPFDQLVKRGMRSVRNAFDQSVLHGVEMNVVHVCLKIVLIAYQVFPVAPLPDVTFAARLARV